MSTSLLKHFKQVAAQDKLDAIYEAAYDKLPKDHGKRWAIALKHLTVLSREHHGKTLPTAVVKSWLYEKGFSESDARSSLWYAVSEGVINFSPDFDIMCGDFDPVDD